jgi:hypothetical protein
VQLGLVRTNAKIDMDALFVLFGRERGGWRWIVLLPGRVAVLVVQRMAILFVVAAARGIALWWRGCHAAARCGFLK